MNCSARSGLQYALVGRNLLIRLEMHFALERHRGKGQYPIWLSVLLAAGGPR